MKWSVCFRGSWHYAKKKSKKPDFEPGVRSREGPGNSFPLINPKSLKFHQLKVKLARNRIHELGILMICVVLARDQAWKANGSRGDKEVNAKTDAQGK
uniref:Uncharacterized protein n=1 Tax=Helianthus annuus TaxID=4232 RepID=A0A251RVI2_HELAN